MIYISFIIESFLAAILTQACISHKIDTSSGTIGRRYSRSDEIAIPFAITIDFDTLKQPYSVTLRERDTFKQIRAKVTRKCSLCSLQLSITSLSCFHRLMRSQLSFKVFLLVQLLGVNSVPNIQNLLNNKQPKNSNSFKLIGLFFFYSSCYSFNLFLAKSDDFLVFLLLKKKNK